MHATPSAPPSIDLRILLRSIGQIVLQANALTGALLVVALALTDPRLACAALLGAAAANMIAVLTRAERRDLEPGLLGFNGALAALAAVTFAPGPLAAIALAPLAAAGAALVQRAMRLPLAKSRLCAYSSPCLAVTALWLPIAASQHANALTTAAPLTLAGYAPVAFSGIARTAFAQGASAGALILAGIAAASRRAAAFALGGAIVSSAILCAFGADAGTLADGLLGFNGALTALALMSRGVRAALAGAVLAALLQWLAMRAGVAALTAPFVLASWCIVLVTRRFSLGDHDVVIRSPS